jgi:hypothetical protein
MGTLLKAKKLNLYWSVFSEKGIKEGAYPSRNLKELYYKSRLLA